MNDFDKIKVQVWNRVGNRTWKRKVIGVRIVMMPRLGVLVVNGMTMSIWDRRIR